MDRKTVLKWRRRASVEDAPMGPRERRSSVLTEVEAAAVVAFRVRTRLALGRRQGVVLQGEGRFSGGYAGVADEHGELR